MKFLVVLFGLIALSCSAPQPRKIFHEHFEDFMDVIMEESKGDLDHLMEHYLEFEEFTASLDYLRTANFKNLVYEMESLPEFKAVTDFLENDNIDIQYFIDRLNTIIEEGFPEPRMTRHELSGTDMSAFIADSIAEFPTAKLQALYDQKIAEDEEFKTTMENLYSDEWNQIYSALWESEVFSNEVQTLMDNGIDVQALLKEVKAIFGQA